jgi:hypothetical protein
MTNVGSARKHPQNKIQCFGKLQSKSVMNGCISGGKDIYRSWRPTTCIPHGQCETQVFPLYFSLLHSPEGGVAAVTLW